MVEFNPQRRKFLELAADGTLIATVIALTPACLQPTEGQASPFRTKREALISYMIRRFLNGVSIPESALERLLNTTLAESRQIGLVNSHLFEEDENADLGNLAFSIKPWDPLVDNGNQKIPLLANTPSFTDFRQDKNAIVRVFDRTVWAANNGRFVTAIIETDEATKENLIFTVNMLLDLGIKNFRIGNETNNPYTPWLANPQTIYESAVQVKKLAEEKGMRVEISLPALAYYGNGEYLRELIKHCRKISNDSELPFTRYAFNFYGPTLDLAPRIKMMHSIANQEGIENFKLDISEIGNPGSEGILEEIPDRKLAEEYIPKALSTAVASGLIEHVSYYSLYSGASEPHSLVRLQGSRFVAKASFRAYSVITKLLAKLRYIDFEQRNEYTKVTGEREDGISFSVIWANEKSFLLQLHPNDLIFDALGERLNHNGSVVVKDPAKIILHSPA